LFYLEVIKMFRTHTCGQLRPEHIGQKVRLSGWVDTIRDHGGVLFVDLRDYYGITQIVLHDDSMLAGVNREACISVTGTVDRRDDETVNPKLETGLVEVAADSLEILGQCENMLPFDPKSSLETREDVRLQYRYLDLRNTSMRDNQLSARLYGGQRICGDTNSYTHCIIT
jgi:aspartyl-tRNA synthetase